MRIKIPDGLLTVDILTVLLILAVLLVPSTIIRFVLGLPFVLFFPGYALLNALFVNKKGTDGLEQIGISCVASIAIVALIGFALSSYTAPGVQLESGLYSVAAFVLLLSSIAFLRRANTPDKIKLTREVNLPSSVWKVSNAKRLKYSIVAVSVIVVVGVVGYSLFVFRAKEAFTEFYVLGLNGKAQDYPTEFVLGDNQTTEVRYGTGNETASNWGKATLVIVNHEQDVISYTLKMKIDGEPVSILYQGNLVNQLDNIQLHRDELWKEELDFAPQHIGDNQKVEFLIFKGNETSPSDSLDLWINVRNATNP